MAVQDDKREKELRKLFRLEKPENEGRIGVDAILNLDKLVVPFELKSTSTGNVTTVRDFGLDHIEKWKNKHWLIGVYSPDGVKLLYSWYGSPEMMAPWIKEKEDYIRPDLMLADEAAKLITKDTMYRILEKKREYTIEDAKKLHKKQLLAGQYKELMDRPHGYSPEKMLEILRMRCAYLIKRGSTLNNPHIPRSYFKGWERITENHAERLRELVVQALERTSTTDLAI